MARKQSNKIKSLKQIEAIKRNWSLYRLEGVVKTLSSVENDLHLIGITGGALNFSNAVIAVRSIIEKIKST